MKKIDDGGQASDYRMVEVEGFRVTDCRLEGRRWINQRFISSSMFKLPGK